VASLVFQQTCHIIFLFSRNGTTEKKQKKGGDLKKLAYFENLTIFYKIFQKEEN